LPVVSTLRLLQRTSPASVRVGCTQRRPEYRLGPQGWLRDRCLVELL